MRQVNFSIPIQNKASVGITTALYDRRALDCTSTLPLFNSLNYLAHLTISSARIRQILTEDGGVERLVCILKSGRSRGDMLDIWKWNLAFQCVVNIGVRGSDGKATDNHGSETIRRRVVEADIVPVIATILDNYQIVIERLRREQEDSDARGNPRLASSRKMFRANREARGERRREAPPPIEVPLSRHSHQEQSDEEFPGDDGPLEESSTGSRTIPVNSPTDRMPPSRLHQAHLRPVSHPVFPPANRNPSTHNRQTSASHLTARHHRNPSPENWARAHDSILPPMTATSQPDTPVTPRMPGNRHIRGTQSPSPDLSTQTSIRQQSLGPADSEDDDQQVEASDPMIGIQGENGDLEMADAATIVDSVDAQDGFGRPDIDGADDALNPLSGDGSNRDLTATPPRPPPFILQTPTPEPPGAGHFRYQLQDRGTSQNFLSLIPRDEDVVLSLQLLAYVSKYCELRSYFQQTHLVPKLKIDNEIQRIDGKEIEAKELEEDDNEYCQPNDYNIFPLVEKFTVRHYSHEMKYWAGVVMRNLCRKDKSRGDIRQCAYYKCGKWEEYARQFAKCRRCRQTKYCSKECQKSAWTLHRWWCTVADNGNGNTSHSR